MSSPANLLPCDGILTLAENVVPDADSMFERLMRDTDWRQETGMLFGRRFPMPRLMAWYGDAGYAYTGVKHVPAAWTPDLLHLKAIAEVHAGVAFNSVLLNLYRDGRDSMGWHADDEKVLGRHPVLASLSLGAERRFQVRHRTMHNSTISMTLPHGSCLVMAGAMQENWKHQVPRTAKPVGPRINLTFRSIAD